MDYVFDRSVWAAATGGMSAGVAQVLPFAIILAIFYFLILLPMKRRQKKIQEFQDSLKVGDRIITTGGMYGQITKVGDKTVQVQVAERVRVEMSRAAVAGYQGQDPVVTEGGSL